MLQNVDTDREAQKRAESQLAKLQQRFDGLQAERARISALNSASRLATCNSMPRTAVYRTPSCNVRARITSDWRSTLPARVASSRPPLHR